MSNEVDIVMPYKMPCYPGEIAWNINKMKNISNKKKNCTVNIQKHHQN